MEIFVMRLYYMSYYMFEPLKLGEIMILHSVSRHRQIFHLWLVLQ